MSTTLEVILKTAGFTEGATAIKKVGDEATNTNNKLKTTTSTVDQVSKSTTSLGSKLANAGKQFSGTITNVAALGSTVVNLKRQYDDLSDTQIRVDKTQLKVSKSAEAVRAAQGKLNDAVKQYGKGSAQAQKAQLDLTQAQEASTLAVTMNGEAMEDQQRAYENFYMGLAPTILTAGSSITSMLKEMGGEKGIGGLATKLKGLGTGGIGTGGLTSLTAALGPLALAALAASVAFIAYDNAMKKVAEAKKEEGLAKNAKNLAEELAHVKKEFDALKLKPGTNIIDFFASMGPGGLQNTVLKWMEDAKTKTIELATETDALKAAKEKLNKALADPSMTDYQTEAGNTARLTALAAEKEVKRLEGIEKTIPAVNKLTSSQVAANNAIKENDANMLGLNNTIQNLADKFGVLNAKIQEMKFPTADVLLFRKAFDKAWGDTATTPGKVLTQQPALDPTDWFIGSWAEASDSFDKGFQDMVKTQADAAAKIKKDQEDAAREVQAAWDKAFGAQVSGIDKIFAAYHKLHPGSTQDIMKKGKKIGERTFEPGKLPIDIAQKFLEQLEAGMAQLVSSPKSAEMWAQNWVKTAGSKLGGVAGQLIKPINDYIHAHSKEPADVFMSGFIQFLQGFNLTEQFSKTFLPVVTVAEDTAGKTTDALGKITVPPTTMASVTGLDKAIKKIPPKTTPSITAKVIGTTQVNALTNAIAHVKSKTVTVAVKAQLDRQLGAILPSATANVKRFVSGKQHGYSGTVKRPTMFMAGEGGRPEDVTVRPRGSAQRGGSGGGGFYGVVNVYVDGVLRPARYDMGARK